MDISRVTKLLRCFFALAIPCLLAACASGPRLAFHSFGFDIGKSVPHVQVIDYRYGDSKLPVHAPEWVVKEGKPLYFNSVGGSMRVGDYLYVKWRIVDTGEVFEDTVDLRHRLPRNMEDMRVIFDIKGAQLYVYLVTPERRFPGTPPNGPRMYDYLKVITLYPEQQKS